MYADDATLFTAASTLPELNENLQHELNTVVDWVKKNKLVMNISKTKCIYCKISYMLPSITPLNLHIESNVVEQVIRFKLLGVRLDNLLSWSESDQIDHIVSKMGRGIAMSRKCSVYCPTATLKNVVQSLVLSHLYYCSVVWSSAAQKHLRKLQIAQNRAARVVLHCSFRASVHEMHIKLSWLTVEAKVKYNLFLLMHKVMANEAYNFIKEKIV